MPKPSVTEIDVNAIREANPEAIVIAAELDGAAMEFAFKRPTRAHIEMLSGGKMSKSLNNIVVDCVLAPARAELVDLLAYYPALTLTLGNKLLEAAGLSDAEIRRP